MARQVQELPEELHIAVVTRKLKDSDDGRSYLAYTRRFGPFTRKADATAALTRAKREVGYGMRDMYEFEVEYLTTKCDWRPQG